MALLEILPSASIAHGNGTSAVFPLFVCFGDSTASYEAVICCESSSSENLLRPIPLNKKILPSYGDSTASYGDDIWESEFFLSASSSFDKKLPSYGLHPLRSRRYYPRILVTSGGGVFLYGSEFFPSASSMCKEELVVIGSRTVSHRENFWESEFVPSASSWWNEELLLIVGASTAWHRESIHLTMLILPSAPIAHWNGTSDVKMMLTWEEPFLARVDTTPGLVGRENIHVTMLNALWFFFCIYVRVLCIHGVFMFCERLHCSLKLVMAIMEAEEMDAMQFLWPATRRFPANNDLPVKLSWAVRLQILRQIASGAIYEYLHMYQRGGYDTSVLMVRETGTHNKFTVAALGTSSTGSPVMHAPKYLSVHHPLVQMVLLARDEFDETFARIKSMVPKSIFDMTKRLCSFALPSGCKADWNSAKSMSESPEVGTLSDLNTENTIGKRNELTENESHLSHPDLSGAQHGIKEVKAKTSAPWVAATAAPHHATGNGDLFSGFLIELDAQFVHAADGVPRKVLARGTVITDAVVLPDVWFVPGLRENLVSVSQLAELDHSIGFGRGECCIRSAGDGKIIGKGRLKQGGHYVLDFLKVPLAI